MVSLAAFPALRYDTARAGDLSRLVAPPYDVIDERERRALLARSPYNIVHLTLPESPEQAAETLASWRQQAVLTEEQPALWWITQDYVGPDGVARTREGIAGSIEASDYSAGVVLPHERTHAGPKEERLRLLRATRTQLEPIFLLYEGEPPLERPAGEPLMDVSSGSVRTRVWRLGEQRLEFDSPLLIADGHHRYETAVAFRGEDPSATHTFAVLVSARSDGLEIFPTHRLAEGVGVEPAAATTARWHPDEFSLYRDGSFFRLDSDDELDARAVESYEPRGLSYTPSGVEAIEAVDAGRAALAFLVRAPTVEQVFAFAGRGEMMPQKSTFFCPKLTSGLLLHPV